MCRIEYVFHFPRWLERVLKGLMFAEHLLITRGLLERNLRGWDPPLRVSHRMQMNQPVLACRVENGKAAQILEVPTAFSARNNQMMLARGLVITLGPTALYDQIKRVVSLSSRFATTGADPAMLATSTATGGMEVLSVGFVSRTLMTQTEQTRLQCVLGAGLSCESRPVAKDSCLACCWANPRASWTREG